MKNRMPTENNKASAPREIINSLSNLRFINKYLHFLTVYSLNYLSAPIYGLLYGVFTLRSVFCWHPFGSVCIKSHLIPKKAKIICAAFLTK